jgi:hypothetical protein
VKCTKPLFGKKVRLVTTQNTYLSINAFEAWTGAPQEETEATGGRPSGQPTKITLKNAFMNKPYSTGSYKADWALRPGATHTAITTNVVGAFWKAEFTGGSQMIEKVRIRNRHDCCGNRIAGTKVTISGQLCGTLPSLGNGAWYTLTCSKPLVGTEIQLTTTRADYLQINAVEPYGWGATATTRPAPTTGGSGSTTYTIPANTKAGINQGTARQSTNYGNNAYPASNAFRNKFTHTNAGVGQWWEVQFNQEYWIDRVRI